MKTCSGCKISKNLDDFGIKTLATDGHQSRCRECLRTPPRTARCAVCGEDFLHNQRGGTPHICPECCSEFHWCTICKTAKRHQEFYRQSAAPAKISYRCKACILQQASSKAGVRSRKAAGVRSRYGISLEEYESLMSAPEGTCPCCGKTGRRKMCLDHDHETGKIRGVICSACNSGIGLLGDDAAGLRRALQYLESTDRKRD